MRALSRFHCAFGVVQLTSGSAEEVSKFLAHLANNGCVNNGCHLFDILEKGFVKECLIAILQPLKEEMFFDVSLTPSKALENLFRLDLHAKLTGGHDASDMEPIALRQAESRALVHDGVMHNAKSTPFRKLGAMKLIIVWMDDGLVFASVRESRRQQIPSCLYPLRND